MPTRMFLGELTQSFANIENVVEIQYSALLGQTMHHSDLSVLNKRGIFFSNIWENIKDI